MSDAELIERLGGPTALAQKLGYGPRGVQRVQNWKRRGIPARVQLDHGDLFRAAASEKREDPAPPPVAAGPVCGLDLPREAA